MATIEAAMARAKAQREAVQPKNTENLTSEQQKVAAEIEARRVAAHLIEPEPAAPASEKTE
jgi:electron transport complex protein RnfC